MAEKSTQPAASDARRLHRRLLGILLLALSVFPWLALATYDWRDIAWLHAPGNRPAANLVGIVGAWGSFVGYMVFGLGVWLLPAWMVVFSGLMAMGRGSRLGRRAAWCVAVTLAFCALLQLGDHLFDRCLTALNLPPNPGGAVGYVLMTRFLAHYLSPVGGSIVLLLLLAGAAVMAIGPATLHQMAVDGVDRWRERRLRNADEAQRLAAEQARLERELEQERRRAAREAARAERDLAREERTRKRAEEEERKQADAEARQKAYEAQKQRLIDERRQEEERLAAAREAAAAAGADARRGRQPPAGGTPATATPAGGAAPTRSAEPQTGAASAQPPPTAAPAEAESETAAASDSVPPPQPEYPLPSTDLLDRTPSGEAVHGDVDAKSRVLVETLAEFSIPVEVTHIERGPVVTSFELLPAPGIRVERIANLAPNIVMKMKATHVRVEAPIPGKGVVGVELPNEKARPVTVREIVEGARWQEAARRMEVPLLLGKDVCGRDLLVDLTTVPHMLIAGATGSGKSVCINAILTALLMSRRPDELRLMLVDPKIVEFSVYNELPHLVAPVITDPKKVALGLRWAIKEMDKRYKLLHAAGVRNIAAYNRRDQSTQLDMFAEAQPAAGAVAQNLPRRLPYILVVIDELADLMLQAGPDIENSVARLAQLSRAVGIHLILATQRPSVNVITGTIKANFPGRIAFQVAQKTDSRIILDHTGAETLIGRGDMLFLDPRTTKLVRAQGAFLSDAETKRITDFIRQQAKPVYIEEVQARLAAGGDDEDDEGPGGGGTTPTGGGDGAAEGGDDEADESLVQQAIQVIRETRRASTSALQRRLRIGYTRAARVMDILEQRGIVGPPRGSDPREILIDLDGAIPNNPPLDAPATATPASPGGAATGGNAADRT